MSLLAIDRGYRHPLMVLLPSTLGLGVLLWGRAILDLSSDPNASIGLLIVVFYALAATAVGGAAGWLLDRFLTRRAA